MMKIKKYNIILASSAWHHPLCSAPVDCSAMFYLITFYMSITILHKWTIQHQNPIPILKYNYTIWASSSRDQYDQANKATNKIQHYRKKYKKRIALCFCLLACDKNTLISVYFNKLNLLLISKLGKAMLCHVWVGSTGVLLVPRRHRKLTCYNTCVV